MEVNGDYLWDRTGSDREVEKMEDLLSPLKLAPGSAAPALPRRRENVGPRVSWRAVAAVLFMIVSAAIGWRQAGRERPAAVIVGASGVLFQKGDGLSAGSELLIPAGERLLLQTADGSHVALGGLSMTRACLGGGRQDGNILALTEGRLEAIVAHGGRDKGEFWIRTPLGDVVDRGTRFVVEVERGEEMSKGGKAGTAVSLAVAVITGWVEFHEGGQAAPVPVRAGQTLVRKPGLPAEISETRSAVPQAPGRDAARDRLHEIERFLDDPSRTRASQGLTELEKRQARLRAQKCAQLLRHIGVACMSFCVDHDGAYPSTVDQLWRGKPTVYFASDDPKCPCRPAGTFVYLQPPLQADWILEPSAWILLHEDSPNLMGERNVLFLDGHVETMAESKFHEILKRQGEVLK